MKNIFKRLLSLCLCACVLLSLFSCASRVSSYSATLLIRSNAGGELSVRFSTLNGRLCESFRKSEGGEGTLHYEASLDGGSLKVSYEDGTGSLAPLFSLKGGESVSGEGGYIEGREGRRVHLVIETDGKCEGGSLRVCFSRGGAA